MPKAFGGQYQADKDPTLGGFAQSTYGAAAKIKAAQDPAFLIAAQQKALQNLLDLLHLGNIDLSWIDAIVAGIGDFLTGLFGDFINFDLGAALDSLFAVIKEWTGIDLTWLDDLFKKLWGFVTAIFGDLVEFLFDPLTAIQNFFTTIKDLLGIDLSWLWDIFKPLWDLLNELFGDLVEFLFDPLTAITNLISSIGRLLGIDLTWLSNTFAKVWTFLNSLFGDLMELFSNPLAALQHFLGQLSALLGIDLSWISTTFKKVWDFLNALFGDLVELLYDPLSAIQHFIGQISALLGIDLSWISDALTKAVDLLKSLFGDFINILTHPVDAINHLFDAIKSLLNIDLSWISTAVTKAITLLTALFGDFVSILINPTTAISNFFAKLKELLITIPSYLLNLTGLPLKDLGSWIDSNITKPFIAVFTKDASRADFGALGAWASKLLTNTSSIPAENLVGKIGAAIFGIIPVANIADTQPNLLTFGTFDLSSAVSDSGQWAFDSTQTATGTGGSVKVTCNASVNEIFSTQAVPTSAGDKISLSAAVKTTSLSATGSPILLSLIPYIGTAQQATTNIVSSGAHTTWTTISGTYTVPTGVTSVITRLAVTGGATSGTVNFDDVKLAKTGLLQQSLVDRLMDAWNNMWKGVFGGTPVGKTVDDILTAIGNVTTTANTGSSNASTLRSSLSSSPSSVVGSIKSVIMDGVSTIGTFLYYLVQGLGQNLTGTVANVYTSAGALSSTANTATATANTASTTAGSATTTANAAQTTANTANTNAGTANGNAITGQKFALLASSQNNLVLSPNFDETAINRFFSTTDYALYNYGYSTDYAATGSYSYKIRMAAAGGIGDYGGIDLSAVGTDGSPIPWNVVAGSVYHYSILYYAPSTNTSAKQLIIMANWWGLLNGAPYGWSAGPPLAYTSPVKGSWQQWSGTFTIPATVNNAVPLMFRPTVGWGSSTNSIAGATGDTIYLDRVLIY